MALPWLPDLSGGMENGVVADTEGAEWLRLGPIRPSDPQAPRDVQAREVWRRAVALVRQSGFSIGDIVRTWLYVHDILGWYDRFNAVRDEVFRDVGMTRYPASTAVGVDTGGRGALVLHLLAVRAIGGAPINVVAVPSPRQGAASEYGSAFSRAIQIATAGRRILLVSGTASIDLEGRTLHPGDRDRQITETAEVVESLLASRGFGCGDICRAIHYSPAETSPKMRPAWFGPWLKSDVCRDDLQVEVELDAVQTVPSTTK